MFHDRIHGLCGSARLVLLATIIAAASAHAMPITYQMTLNAGSSGNVTVDTVTELVTAFELNTTVPANPCCAPPATPPIMLTITLADFDSAADLPQAVFFGGAFAGLDFSGNATLPDFDIFLDFQVVAIDAASIDLTMAGPGQITVQQLSTDNIFDGIYSQSYVEDDQKAVPEPGSALLFAAGAVLVARRRIGHR
jgi:hypothetical protein